MTLRQVGHYRLEGLLGSGGMGEVYKAYDTHRERYVALKLLPEALAGDQEYLKRFRRESNVAARLTEPHVIPIHDFGEVAGQLFIDMRLVDGADIRALLDRDGRIAPRRAVHLVSQVAQALDAAHADRLVHRDIKPSNILVNSSDFVYVVDFGIARPADDRRTSPAITGETIGTLHYMAPERFAGEDVDGRADVYSLACVLYECLTGEPPFKGKDLPALLYAQVFSDPPQASSLVGDVPRALDAVIARGMAKDPKDRFATAGALAAAAREALPGEAPPPVAEPPAQTWTESPAPTWPPAPAATAWPGAANPPSPAPEPAGDRFARSVPDGLMETVTVDSVNAGGGTWLPVDPPRGTAPDPVRDPLPGGTGDRPERGPARRRLGWLILTAAVVVAAVAVPVALVLTASDKPGAGGAAAAPGAGVTRTPAAGSAATGSAPSSAVAPKVAGTVPVGQTPSYVQVAPNGGFAYVANPGASAVTVLNTATDKVSGTIKISQGPPQFVSYSPDSKTAYVSVYNTRGSVHLVAFIDTATRAVTATVPVDNFTPGPSTTSPDGRYLYVPNHNTAMSGANENAVDVIDTASRKPIGDIHVPANPHWVVFDKNGRFYTTDHMSAKVTVINAHNNAIVAEIQVGETPHSEAVSPDGSRLAVTSFNGNEVFLISTATDKMIAQIPVGRNPLDIAYSPDGRSLYTVDNEDNTVTVIDTASNRVVAEVPTG